MPSIGRMIFMFAFVATLLSAIEWLAYRLLKRQSSESPSWVLIKRSWIFLIGVIWIAFVINGFMWPTWRVTHPRLLSVLSVSFFVVFVPKLMMAGFEVLEVIRGGAAWGVNQLIQSSRPISRKSFLTQAGMGLSGATFLSFLYGVTWGKYAFRTERISIPIEKLPSGLSGMKIVQISDAHLGSFTDTPKPVLDALEGINKLDPDLILFTGDLVNTHADEAEAWIPAFKSLKSRLGKFSIMGNHDYADYGPFEDWEREESRAKLKEIHTEMGFKLMLNEHERVEYNGAALVLLGVENWGSGFRKNGDLIKAMEGSGCQEMLTILMTHDPTHWEEKVMDGKAPVELTLSGHTHGMQFGIEIPWLGVKWSPSKWRYNRWAGLYKEGEQYLHVNRGFGVLGFHGRVGMPPEITVLELVQA
ncbi:MAG: phosphoesterase [Flavobacteriales bacterium]|nr:phosphoesterase [Flavobacteriales bacterium]